MEFIDVPIESPARSGTESPAFARYASTATPVRHPRTVYLFKWLAIFQDGVNHFMMSHANSTDGWQKAIAHNVTSDTNPTPHDVTYEFTPPLIGIISITGDSSANNAFSQDASGESVSKAIPIDDFLNQMIGSDRKGGSMKLILDAGTLLNAPDGARLYWSYKDSFSEGSSKGFDFLSTLTDFTGVTGELQQVDGAYFAASEVPPGILISNEQAISYFGFSDFGDVVAAQSLAPATGVDCIMIEWVIGSQGPLFPIVTAVPGQSIPFLIPIPDIKTLWTRAASILPYNGGYIYPQGIINKLYPQYADEAAWRAAGAHF